MYNTAYFDKRLHKKFCKTRWQKKLPWATGISVPGAVYRNKIQFNGKIYWNRYSKCWTNFQYIHLRNWDNCNTVGPIFVSLCRRSLPPGIRTTVTLIPASLSFWKRWPDKNFMRYKKRWNSLNSCRRSADHRVLTVEPCVAIDLAQLTMNFDRCYALCIQKRYHRPHFTLDGCRNNSLHRQPLQRCYCENSMTYTEWLHAINGLITVRRSVIRISGSLL